LWWNLHAARTHGADVKNGLSCILARTKSSATFPTPHHCLHAMSQPKPWILRPAACPGSCILLLKLSHLLSLSVPIDSIRNFRARCGDKPPKCTTKLFTTEARHRIRCVPWCATFPDTDQARASARCYSAVYSHLAAVRCRCTSQMLSAVAGQHSAHTSSRSLNALDCGPLDA
jgi:hypothetical protein